MCPAMGTTHSVLSVATAEKEVPMALVGKAVSWLPSSRRVSRLVRPLKISVGSSEIALYERSSVTSADSPANVVGVSSTAVCICAWLLNILQAHDAKSAQ